ncbi:hypothetical protein NEFER03_1695 [Nematocida sp. LUAm3]|nr:hypothetical protein NEFER03_1695 [Nematocida sp. LUAm3]KAI5175685.1 hypothetical protein NEFER02_1572 [Nematocida sp. LUAm2]KAI5178591.1 hypothetical protein NEFER01_1727 [Nematocida sp. LUAm1]
MKSIQLAYNKLSSSTIGTAFKEIEQEYRKNKEECREALIRIISSSEIEENTLVVASLLKLIYSAIDTEIVSQIIEKTCSVRLFCYLNAYGVVDTSFVTRIISDLLKKSDLISILKIFQICGGKLEKESVKMIKENIPGSSGFLSEFLLWSCDQMLSGHVPFRDTLKEELSSMEASLEETIRKHEIHSFSVLTETTDHEEKIAAKYGMNTILKKRIFTIIATSKDYTEAQRLLYKEGLKVKQFEEVFYLLCFLCTKEEIYNPYYSDLSLSLLTTSSSNHSSTFNKYMYKGIEKHISRISSLPVREVYNLGRYISAAYIEGVISINFINSLGFLLKKEAILAKVLFKEILEAYRSKKLKAPRKMKETEEVKRLFKEKLIDDSFLEQKDKSDLNIIYHIMYKKE